jgi:hypothetical protein
MNFFLLTTSEQNQNESSSHMVLHNVRLYCKTYMCENSVHTHIVLELLLCCIIKYLRREHNVMQS